MTVFNEAVTQRITAEARETHFWRTALTVIAGLLFGLGWITYKTFAGLWFIGAWTGTAIKVGWQEAHSADRAT